MFVLARRVSQILTRVQKTAPPTSQKRRGSSGSHMVAVVSKRAHVLHYVTLGASQPGSPSIVTSNCCFCENFEHGQTGSPSPASPGFLGEIELAPRRNSWPVRSHDAPITNAWVGQPPAHRSNQVTRKPDPPAAQLSPKFRLNALHSLRVPRAPVHDCNTSAHPETQLPFPTAQSAPPSI